PPCQTYPEMKMLQYSGGLAPQQSWRVALAAAGFLTTLSLGPAALAQTAGAAGDARTLAPIRVTGEPSQSPLGPVDGYIATRALTASKSDVPLIETPQSISVVTQDEIRDMGATGLQEALNYAAGVRSEAYGLDSRSDNFRIRGSSPSVYLDG